MTNNSVLMQIAQIERHSARAWPAPISIAVHGWEMRFAPNSSSRRVNSLNPVKPEAGQFPSVLSAYLEECLKQNSKAHVRLLPLARDHEAEMLQSLGLKGEGATSVETTGLNVALMDDPQIILSAHADDAWLDAYIGAHHYSKEERLVVRDILSTIPYAMGFARLVENGIPVAVGRTAIIGGLAGFYQIATAPEARRKGYARRIVSALMGYAAGQGARSGYLQVEMRNTYARALYGSLGFKPLYIYDYWSVPTSINL